MHDSQQDQPDNCFSRVNFLCLLHSVSVPPAVTAVACERPRSFCHKCRWRVREKHACTLDPTGLTMLSRQNVGTLGKNELACNSSGNAHLQLPQLAEPLWADPDQSVRADLHFKKKMSGNESSIEPSPKSSHARKTPPPKLRGIYHPNLTLTEK